MIKLTSLNKYFNKGRSNQIHVLNDVSLDLPNKGLVVFLGPSGSGKTTLLNVIGGLDKVQSGEVVFDDKKISRYQSSTWDELRRNDIGYIFQNYYLIPYLSVFDNVAFVLKMMGLTDEKEIKEKVEYVLKSVGMFKYRKKKALQLSGGQQQRVAIARALVKNPRVIIADEPTGNLDSRNTLDVMNIINSISKQTLVILVTHEKDIANYYADYIHEFKDGRIIKSFENHQKNEGVMSHKDDAIYLKDFEIQESSQNEHMNLKYYAPKRQEPLNLKIIIKNDTVYIDLEGLNDKIRVIDKNNRNLVIKDQHSNEGKQEDITETSFDRSKLEVSKSSKKNMRLFSIKHTILMALKKVLGYGLRGKLMLVGFMFAGLITSFIFLALTTTLFSSYETYLTRSENYIVAEGENLSYDNIRTTIGHDKFKIAPRNQYAIRLSLPKSSFVLFNAEIEYADRLKESDLQKGGRLPQNDFEIVVSSGALILDKLSLTNLMQYGIWDNNVVGEKVNVGNMVYQIVGIVNKPTKTVYLNSLKAVAYTMTPYQPFEFESINNDTTTYLYTKLYEYVDPNKVEFYYQGSKIVDYTLNEIITESKEISYELKVFDKKFNNDYLNHQGYGNIPFVMINHDNPQYQSVSALNDFIMNGGGYSNVRMQSEVYIDTDEPKTALENLNKVYGAYSVKDYAKRMNQKAKEEGLASTLPFQLIVLVGVSIGFYFLMRSSMFSRIYDISVYRALGIKRRDVLFSFLIEILVITTLTYVVGYLIGSYFVYHITQSVVGMMLPLAVTGLSIVLGILFMYIINTIIGLLPMYMLLRKTPAQILSQYDI